MRFFGLKSCDTCRKALKVLGDVEVIDVRSDGVSDADLEAILSAFGDMAVNTRSTTWRALNEAERARPPLELLRDHPTLMKRPVIHDEGQWYLGWTADVQAAVIKD
jgi:arsenate reductase